MIIDAHAHACGEYHDLESILKVLDSNHVGKVVLCPGEANSTKTYRLPPLSHLFPERDFMFAVNSIIGLVTRISGSAAQIDQQNEHVNRLARMCPESKPTGQTHWKTPLLRSSKLITGDSDSGFSSCTSAGTGLIFALQTWMK